MQILTIDDLDFPNLLTAFKEGTTVGHYIKDGKTQVVCVTSQFMLVSQGVEPEKIAIKPARNTKEAESYALRFLHREKERGSTVEIAAEYKI